MGIDTFPYYETTYPSYYQSTFIDPKSSAWDPFATLQIVNPDRGCLTCVGYAPSRRRRCRNPIAAGNRLLVYNMLEEISNISPDSKYMRSQLRLIAALSLCQRYHQNQVDSVVDEWLFRISLMHTLRRQTSQIDVDIHHARPQATRGSHWQSGSSASYGPGGLPRTSTSNRQTYEQNIGERQQRWDRGYWEQKGREAAQAENERQERARKARAERELQDEKLKQQAAQRKREEQRKQTQEKAAQEKKVWEKRWENYVKGWALFRECKQENAADSIPWPVKSGCRVDVTEANVKIFFQNAPPNASVPTAMFKIMSMENLKWHPDKISSAFGGERPEDVAMIGRVVIQLRATAQYERNKG